MVNVNYMQQYYIIRCLGKTLIILILNIYCFQLPHFRQEKFSPVDEYVGNGELTPARKFSESIKTVVACSSFFLYTYLLYAQLYSYQLY